MKKNSFRQPQIILLVGARGHGKSTELAALLEQHRYPNALVYKEGVNVYDAAFTGWPVVPLDRYAGGKAIIDAGQITCSKGEKPYPKFLRLVDKHFRKGVCVIDDAVMYEINDLSPEIVPLLSNVRRMHVDLILVYHGLSTVPIRMFSYVNKIILFHTTDKPDYKLNKIPAGDEILKAKALLARRAAAGDKYARMVIKLSD